MHVINKVLQREGTNAPALFPAHNIQHMKFSGSPFVLFFDFLIRIEQQGIFVKRIYILIFSNCAAYKLQNFLEGIGMTQPSKK